MSSSVGDSTTAGPQLACSNFCTSFKYVYSTGLVFLSIAIIIALIVQRDTKLSRDLHPAVAFCLIVGALLWLNMVEGSQGALVGLPPVNQELYKKSHPKSYLCTAITNQGDNLDRFLIGRQFMVLCIVFVTNLAGAPLIGSSVFGLPDSFHQLFLGTGLAMILVTTNVGQLNSQVNASHCMLDYINNYFALFTIHVALFIEWTGILHSCYLVQYIVAALSGKPIQSNEPPRNPIDNIWFWGKVVMSCAILGLCFAVTLEALFHGQTTMWAGVPPAVSVILFFVFMSIVGLLEGMQIAFFAVTKLPKSEYSNNPIALKTTELLFDAKDKNLPGFMIGRQLCVTLNFFVIARVTTITTDPNGTDTIFGVSPTIQQFFNTGLMGAIITTIVGSITWQLTASAFPVAFLSNPLVYLFLRFALLLEATGICSASWVFAGIHKKVAGFQVDEEYIGSPEERALNKEETADPSEPGNTTILTKRMSILCECGRQHTLVPSVTTIKTNLVEYASADDTLSETERLSGSDRSKDEEEDDNDTSTEQQEGGEQV